MERNSGCKSLKTPFFTQGLPDVEGSNHAHDVIPVKSALKYFEKRGWESHVAGNILNNIKPSSLSYEYRGSSKEVAANRVVFGEAVNSVLDTLSKEEAARKVLVIDSEFRPRVGTVYPLTGLTRRLGGFHGSEGHPSKTSRGLPSIWYHRER